MSWDRVYRLVKQIPRGRVTTYGAIAKAIREPGGARVVGYAMSATPAGRGIPWHRVISAGGKIRMPEPHASKQRRLGAETEKIRQAKEENEEAQSKKVERLQRQSCPPTRICGWPILLAFGRVGIFAKSFATLRCRSAM